jgi:hypothetical protein
MTKQKKRAAREDKSYLVATFPNFPGVEIPLLSDEECQARGIERGRLPPPDTWSQEQQKARHELGVLLYQMAAGQALSVLSSATYAMKSSDYGDLVAFEKEAARRAIDMIANGTWKPDRGQTYTYGLEDWMQHFLRSIVSGEFSLIQAADHADESA